MKEERRLLNEFEMRGFMAQKRSMESRKRGNAAGQRALSREEGDVIREYDAMHEENFLSSWLRKDLVGKEDDKEIREEVKRKGKRKEEARKKGTKR